MLKTNVNFFDLRRIFIRVKNVLLVAHPNPDLDCLCAMKVIQFLLNRYFAKKPVLFSKDPIPSDYRNLFTDVIHEVDINNFDCIIAVELGSYKRFTEVVPIMDSKIIINIDHHISNDLFGNYYYVDVNSSSVNEVLYDIIKQNGIPIDSDIAYYLVMGVISDTGMLSYNNVSSKTLSMLAELRNYVDWQDIIKTIRSRKFMYYKMLSVLYNNLVKRGRVVYGYVTSDEFTKLESMGFDKADINNVIENIFFIHEAELFFVVLEIEPEYCRVSLRSREIDVEEIASSFGGGGHKRASGFRIRKKPQEVIEILIKKLEERRYGDILS
ncbi:MAG: DHHA1 domain-containing protein [Candidatus Calescibacterium sp.]|nr:DHHA1 domain-containing protein [Candidatus Calescibacterium sp.]MCX7972027.1 DHHA1 domain-containing protein [bacterium]MDW8194689.1 DHHA1 domain-containing protein [Candidatus Calescibacterium sp.]